MKISISWVRSAVAAALAFTSGVAFGGGFAIAPQSGTGTGNAFSGGAAVVEDASVVWFNPAGMSLLPQGKHVSFGLTAVKTSHKFQNEGSTGAFAIGGDGGNGGGWGYLPNGYFAMDIDPKWSFGIGINAPFGLKTNYDAGWQGQLVALKSSVESININPSVAYKASDKVSIGAGVSVQKLKAELTKAAGPLGIASLNADDVGYGFNLGLMVQAAPTTRIGASYRSSIKYELEGTATFSTALGSMFNGNIEADLKVPDSASVSVFHDAGSKWELMGDVTWTKWSTLQQLVVLRTSGTPVPGREPPLTSEQFQWDDTWRFGVGANYKMSGQTKLRFGLAYDQTPTNDLTRTPRLPGQDRTWVAFGVQYKPSKAGTLEFGYAHEFISDANVNNTVTGVPGALVGKFENQADILSVQYSHSF